MSTSFFAQSMPVRVDELWLGFYFLLLSFLLFVCILCKKIYLARLKNVALYLCRRQCFGSGIGLGLGPDCQLSGSTSGSGYRRTKTTHKNRKKLSNLMFWSVGCYLLRGEGFFCSLDVLYGGLGIGKLQFSSFLVIKTINLDWIRIRTGSWSGSGSVFCLKYWMDPDPDQMNTDPKHWLQEMFCCGLFIKSSSKLYFM
jgi:hypothetical protein